MVCQRWRAGGRSVLAACTPAAEAAAGGGYKLHPDAGKATSRLFTASVQRRPKAVPRVVARPRQLPVSSNS